MFFESASRFPQQRKITCKVPFALDYNSAFGSTNVCVRDGKLLYQNSFEVISQNSAESFVYATNSGFVYTDGSYTYRATSVSDSSITAVRIATHTCNRGIEFRGENYYCTNSAVCDDEDNEVYQGSVLDIVSCRDHIVAVDSFDNIIIGVGGLTDTSFVTAPSHVDKLAVWDNQVYAFGDGIYRLDIRSPMAQSKFVCVSSDIVVDTKTVVRGTNGVFFVSGDCLFRLQGDKAVKVCRLPIDWDNIGNFFVYYDDCIVFAYQSANNKHYVLFVSGQDGSLQCVLQQNVDEMLVSCGHLYALIGGKIYCLKRNVGRSTFACCCDFGSDQRKVLRKLSVKTAYPITLSVKGSGGSVTYNLDGSPNVQYVDVCLPSKQFDLTISANGKVAVEQLSLVAKCNVKEVI